MTSWSEANRVIPLSAAATAIAAPKHPIAAAKHRWTNFIAGEHGALFRRAKAQLPTFEGTRIPALIEDHATAVQLDAAGNAYVTGHFSGTANFGNTNIPTVAFNDVFVAKYATN